jgi:thiamine biosynthesis lipoprotein
MIIATADGRAVAAGARDRDGAATDDNAPVMAGASAVRLALAAMGTRFELALFGDDPVHLRATGEAALAEIEACHHRFTRFADGSLIARIRRAPAGATIRVDTDTFELFADAIAVHHASDGAFDIALAPLVDALVAGGPAPDPGSRAPGMDAIRLDAASRALHVLRPGLSLDLGAIAKGHALDLAARVLREHGVASALLHGGTSSVIGIGAPPDAAAWRIGVAHAPATGPFELHDAALAVSTARGDTRGDVTLVPHVVDPRSGSPVARSRGVAVTGPSARLADAWATTLVVLGERPAALGPEWTTRFFDTDPV